MNSTYPGNFRLACGCGLPRSKATWVFSRLTERQTVKTNHVLHDAIREDVQNQTQRDLYPEERALSASLIMVSDEEGTFRLLVLGDNGAPVHVSAPCPADFAPAQDTTVGARVDTDPWEPAVNISFHRMSHTLVADGTGLDNYMFDNSSPMNLSK